MQHVLKFYLAIDLQSTRIVVLNFLCWEFCLLKLATTFWPVYFRYLTKYRSYSVKATGKLLPMWWLLPPSWSMRMLILKMPHGNFIFPVHRKELCHLHMLDHTMSIRRKLHTKLFLFIAIIQEEWHFSLAAQDLNILHWTPPKSIPLESTAN